MFPKNFNPLDDPLNYNRALRRVFRIEKNQDNVAPQATAITPSLKPNAHQYTVDSGVAIPKLDELVTQAESYILELDELMYDWQEFHRSQYERKGIRRTRAIKPRFQPRPRKIKDITDAIKQEYDDENEYEFNPDDGWNEDESQIMWDFTRQDAIDQMYANYLRDEYQRKLDHEANREAQINAEDEAYAEEHPDPNREDYISRSVGLSAYFKKLNALQPKILKAVAKVIPIINSLKITYKSKVSGLNLNRIEPVDMDKIKSLMDDFFDKAEKLKESMKVQKRMIVEDNNQFTKAEVPEQIQGVQFRQQFDEAEKKYIKQIDDFNSLYKSDQMRYVYNHAKV